MQRNFSLSMIRVRIHSLLKGKSGLLLLIGAFFVLLSAGYTYQGVRSASRLYPSSLGTQIQIRAYDLTPRWVGTRNLLFSGINPYSDQGCALIEEAYFGRSLKPGEKDKVGDLQHFAYPLYAVLLYAPTVFMSLPDASLVVWIVSFLALFVSLSLWLKMVGLNRLIYFLLFGSFFLSWPQIYVGVQGRQPILFVFFFISMGTYLIICRENKIPHFAAGVFLFFSTIKPQSSIFAIFYLLGIWLPSLGDRCRIYRFLSGFISMMVISLIVTLYLVPGWLGEFLKALLHYREYAGTTGAESLWGKGLFSVSLMSLFVALGIWMSIFSYKAHQHDLHLIVYGYWLVLQGLVFPAHSYVAIMGIPAVVMAFKKGLSFLKEQEKVQFGAIGIGFLMMVYTTYKYWFGIACEARLSEPLSNISCKITAVLPELKLPTLAILGIVLFLDWIWKDLHFFVVLKPTPNDR